MKMHIEFLELIILNHDPRLTPPTTVGPMATVQMGAHILYIKLF